MPPTMRNGTSENPRGVMSLPPMLGASRGCNQPHELLWRMPKTIRPNPPAERTAPNQPKVLFERADTYIRGRRNLEAARELLKRYLAAELNPDDPPRHEAEKLLRQASRS